MSDRYEQLEITMRGELEDWLAAHHAVSPGIWLVTYKKSSDPDLYVPYDAVVEEVLRVGWVDSQSRGLDERRSQLLLTPRKPKSKWSRSNKQRIARLEAAGLMLPAGAAMVALAQETGTWTALDDVENLIEPDELRAALDAVPAARAAWDAFPRSAKRGILEWIAAAKRPETRAKRIAETVSEAEAGRRANQWRQPDDR